MDKEAAGRDAESVVHEFLDFLEERYNINRQELTGLLSKKQEELAVPIEIFSYRKLGCMESAVKFLRENRGLSYKKISELLGRSRSTIGVMYHRANQKLDEHFLEFPASNHLIPLSQFADERYSALESVVFYLKERGVDLSKIARMLNRDYRTIYTVYRRGKERNEE